MHCCRWCREKCFYRKPHDSGPSIEVCERDLVIVDVVNSLPSSSVTIHWHGVLQRNSQFYDGVPYVTQCPILPGNIFRYKWEAKEPGTHFWHSHTGLQKVDGISGPIIIREASVNNPYAFMYNYDLSSHVVFLQEWSHEYMDEKNPGRKYSKVSHNPDNILINGKGQYLNLTTRQYTNVSTEVFTVKPNFRYRFRMINALSSICPVQITIENHNLIVIAVDGNPIKPVEVTSIISTSAERYDFIVETNLLGGAYWIQVKGLQTCRQENLNQVAILRYTNGYQFPIYPRPTNNYPLPTGKVLNPLDANCDRPRSDAICINQLSSDKNRDQAILENNVTKIFLPFRFHFYDDKVFKPNTYERFQINEGKIFYAGLIDNITYSSPPAPLLTQYENLDSTHFCNGDQIIKSDGLTKKCTHVIKVRYNSIVELILVDEVGINVIHHPFHLHGFAFHVMGVGKMPSNGQGTVQEAIMLDKQNLLKRRYDYPPQKDTIMIPSKGYVVLRFRANNQGFWLLHCHFLLHLITGMSAVLQVGESDYMPTPPPGFPKCGNYLPYI
ncbi:hypothetical protein FQR65_LT08938 [Abscondita terminalis]|nr:hypothetical protein FQR65_LT08938 [Abscondita terminalis]